MSLFFLQLKLMTKYALQCKQKIETEILPNLDFKLL